MGNNARSETFHLRQICFSDGPSSITADNYFRGNRGLHQSTGHVTCCHDVSKRERLELKLTNESFTTEAYNIQT